jgi:hypothetical protein
MTSSGRTVGELEPCKRFEVLPRYLQVKRKGKVVPVNINISAIKIGALQIEPPPKKTQS